MSEPKKPIWFFRWANCYKVHRAMLIIENIDILNGYLKKNRQWQRISARAFTTEQVSRARFLRKEEAQGKQTHPFDGVLQAELDPTWQKLSKWIFPFGQQKYRNPPKWIAILVAATCRWCTREDSNLWPQESESCALSSWATSTHSLTASWLYTVIFTKSRKVACFLWKKMTNCRN